MNLFQQYLHEAISLLAGERFGLGLNALRQALLLRTQSPTAHRAMLSCCFALGRSPDALYHGTLCRELGGDHGSSLTALIGRAGIAYAESLAELGIAEAVEFYQGALRRLRHANSQAGEDPLLAALVRSEASIPLLVAPLGDEKLHLHYHDPFIAWAGPASRIAYLERLEERRRREGHLVRYSSHDLTSGLLQLDRPLQTTGEIARLPVRQIWEMTAPLGLETGRPLRTLTFIELEDGPLQILVEPWLDRIGSRREIRLAWDAAAAFAA